MLIEYVDQCTYYGSGKFGTSMVSPKSDSTERIAQAKGKGEG